MLSSQEVKLQGTTRTEDLINSLPQAFAAQGSNVSNGATGTATVNLRGLGSNRTLVLINGRRLHAGRPDRRRQRRRTLTSSRSTLIKRVDVLTGGASSVYGADAVAGVVNFIMDTNFAAFASTPRRACSCMTIAPIRRHPRRERKSRAFVRRTA